jgi:hypothetical protein
MKAIGVFPKDFRKKMRMIYSKQQRGNLKKKRELFPPESLFLLDPLFRKIKKMFMHGHLK